MLAYLESLLEGEYELLAWHPEHPDWIFPNKTFIAGPNQDKTQKLSIGLVSPLQLGLKQLGSSEWVHQGESQDYEVALGNKGQENINDINISLMLPEGVSPIETDGTFSDWSECLANAGGGLLCQSSASLTGKGNLSLVLKVVHQQSGRQLIRAAASMPGYPVVSARYNALVEPYFSVTSKTYPDTLKAGGLNQSITHVFTVELSEYAKQAGMHTATHVILELPRSENIRYVDVRTQDGQCQANGDIGFICQLKDLSHTAPNHSQAVVEVETVLTEPGLMASIQTARASADGYASDTSQGYVKVDFGEAQVDAVIALDVTGSMRWELASVRHAVGEMINFAQETGYSPLTALISFTDNVKVLAVSDDLSVIAQALDKLSARGGNACQEASAEAIQLAVAHLPKQGVLIFASDAPPYDGTDIDELTAMMQEKEIYFLPLVSIADCPTNHMSNSGDWRP